jgi:hypothetical protein
MRMLYTPALAVAPREVEVLEVDFVTGLALVEHALPRESFLREATGQVLVRRRVPQTMLRHLEASSPA